MKKPSRNQRVPDAMNGVDDSPASAEITQLEQRISAALRAEAAAAADELELRYVELDADSTSDEEAFAESLRATWQAEADASHTQHAGAPKREGHTAILPQDEARPQRRPFSLIADSWWAGAAAAAVIAGVVGLYEASSHAGNAADAAASAETPIEYATYLGGQNQPSASPSGEVSQRGPSTVPRILPDTVDFSMDGSMTGTFRIEIHDTDRDARIDDVPGAPFQVTVYEPRWTCSEVERAKLPDVFWLKAFRSVDPPGSAVVWKELFARQ